MALQLYFYKCKDLLQLQTFLRAWKWQTIWLWRNRLDS